MKNIDKLVAKVKNSSFFALTFNFLLLIAAFLICRTIFILFNNIYFEGIGFQRTFRIFYGGIMFDIAAVCYLLSVPYLMAIMPFKWCLNGLYQKIFKYFFVFAATLGVVANFVDTVYYQFSGRRSTISVFSEFENENNIFSIVLNAIVTNWYLVLIAVAFAFVFFKFSRIADKNSFETISPKKYFLFHFPFSLLFVYLYLAGVRGSIHVDNDHRPINLNNANVYITKSSEAAAVLNTPYSLIRTIGDITYKNPNYFLDNDSLNAFYSPVHIPNSDVPMTKPNIVILILESFGKEYSGFFNPDLYPDGNGFTPFLDSLYQNGLTFTKSFATGRKSIDAMPSVLAGIPYITDHFFMSIYSNNKVNSIASLLNDEGYHSAFFHGAPNGSMGFDNFAKLAGFKEYYGLNEYCVDTAFNAMDDFDDYWAIWDEEFLQFYAKK